MSKLTLADGKEYNVREEDFRILREEWNEYSLVADGTRIRFRATIQTVFRVLDESGNPMVTPEGEPFVVVRHKTELAARA